MKTKNVICSTPSKVQTSAWRPIEEYDLLKNKPRYVIFYVEPVSHPTRWELSKPFVLSDNRYYGRRFVSKWIELPDPESKS